MSRNCCLLFALLPGLFLASCAPPSGPAADQEQVTIEEEMTEDVVKAVEEVEEATDEAPRAAPEETPASAAKSAPAEEAGADTEWISLFNGENLEGWTQRGAAKWEVVDGVMTGRSEGGQGHIYAEPVLTDLEVKGMFRIAEEGDKANSGLYFRANPPEDNVDGYPNGYEAQICHSQDAHTGWLWKPGAPTGEATKLLTEDGEWFSMRVKAVGPNLQIWVNDELVMTYEDGEYKEGRFAIQCHNEGMVVEAKELYYRDLSQQ